MDSYRKEVKDLDILMRGYEVISKTYNKCVTNGGQLQRLYHQLTSVFSANFLPMNEKRNGVQQCIYLFQPKNVIQDAQWNKRMEEPIRLNCIDQEDFYKIYSRCRECDPGLMDGLERLGEYRFGYKAVNSNVPLFCFLAEPGGDNSTSVKVFRKDLACFSGSNESPSASIISAVRSLHDCIFGVEKDFCTVKDMLDQFEVSLEDYLATNGIYEVNRNALIEAISVLLEVLSVVFWTRKDITDLRSLWEESTQSEKPYLGGGYGASSSSGWNNGFAGSFNGSVSSWGRGVGDNASLSSYWGKGSGNDSSGHKPKSSKGRQIPSSWGDFGTHASSRQSIFNRCDNISWASNCKPSVEGTSIQDRSRSSFQSVHNNNPSANVVSPTEPYGRSWRKRSHSQSLQSWTKVVSQDIQTTRNIFNARSSGKSKKWERSHTKMNNSHDRSQTSSQWARDGFGCYETDSQHSGGGHYVGKK